MTDVLTFATTPPIIERYRLLCKVYNTPPIRAFTKLLQTFTFHDATWTFASIGTRGNSAAVVAHCRIVADLVGHARRLQQLCLVNFGYDDDTVPHLIEQLLAHPAVRSVDLSDNPITSVTGARLFAAFCHGRRLRHPTLRSIRTENTFVDTAARASLAKLPAPSPTSPTTSSLPASSSSLSLSSSLSPEAKRAEPWSLSAGHSSSSIYASKARSAAPPSIMNLLLSSSWATKATPSFHSDGTGDAYVHKDVVYAAALNDARATAGDKNVFAGEAPPTAVTAPTVAMAEVAAATVVQPRSLPLTTLTAALTPNTSQHRGARRRRPHFGAASLASALPSMSLANARARDDALDALVREQSNREPPRGGNGSRGGGGGDGGKVSLRSIQRHVERAEINLLSGAGQPLRQAVTKQRRAQAAEAKASRRRQLNDIEQRTREKKEVATAVAAAAVSAPATHKVTAAAVAASAAATVSAEPLFTATAATAAPTAFMLVMEGGYDAATTVAVMSVASNTETVTVTEREAETETSATTAVSSAVTTTGAAPRRRLGKSPSEISLPAASLTRCKEGGGAARKTRSDNKRAPLLAPLPVLHAPQRHNKQRRALPGGDAGVGSALGDKTASQQASVVTRREAGRRTLLKRRAKQQQADEEIHYGLMVATNRSRRNSMHGQEKVTDPLLSWFDRTASAQAAAAEEEAVREKATATRAAVRAAAMKVTMAAAAVAETAPAPSTPSPRSFFPE
jgi:hypothetical protein